MSKITELGPITGSNTRPEDLFVIVNLVQGDDGTKNITRRELVQAIQFEQFDDIEITGGTIQNVALADSEVSDVTIEESEFNNGTLTRSEAEDLTITNSSISESTMDNTEITDSTYSDGELENVDGDNVRLVNSSVKDSTIENVDGDNVRLVNSSVDDSTIENAAITNSSFDTGTGANNVLSDTTLDSGTADDFEIANSNIESSTANNITVTQSTFTDGIIDKSQLVDFDIDLDNRFEPNLDENSYFVLKNAKTGETEQITYKQFFDEISKTTESALKVYVSPDGDDTFPATILQPVRTLARASEIALEKAGGEFGRNDVNNAVHISAGPGTYFLKKSVPLPDDCALTSSAGQYATVIEMEPGFEKTNGILVGSGCYVQGFSFQNFEIDNFDFPERGFGVAYRPGALMRRSPYIRDSSQLSNFRRLDVEPPLQPFNSKGTVADLGHKITLTGPITGAFEIDDEVIFSSGAFGYVSRLEELAADNVLYVRNLRGTVRPNDLILTNFGTSAVVLELGDEDFPNKLVGRGGGVVLADRRQLDPDSLYTYMLCFGATPRTQNGMGYVARDGAGVNGIGSLSIFVRCAFYALNGGQMTLNNSGTQFGDISMRAKGSTEIYVPKTTNVALTQNRALADTIEANKEPIIDDLINYLDVDLGYTGYSADKCERDTKNIIFYLGFDIALDSNYWGRLNGILYRSPISYVVVDEQLEATSDALTHLKAEVANIFVNADPDIVVRSDRSFDETINILNNGQEVASEIIFTDTGDANRTAARTLIQDNKALILQGLVDVINEEFPELNYDETKCERDTGYIIDGFSYDLNYDGNIATRFNADFYFWNNVLRLPEDQLEPTALAYRRIGEICSQIVLGTFPGQSTVGGIASIEESDKVKRLADMYYLTLINNDIKRLSVFKEPDLTWQANQFVGPKFILNTRKRALAREVVRFVNATFRYYDTLLTRRDAGNLLTTLANDFRIDSPVFGTFGSQKATRTFVASLFDFDGTHVFPVFNPQKSGLKYLGSFGTTGELPNTGQKLNHAYIIAVDITYNFYEGEIFYWDGTAYVSDGQNNTELLKSFYLSWERINAFIQENYLGSLTSTPQIASINMLNGLIDDILVAGVLTPSTLTFGSLVESIAHQFNGASSGVNRTALPLNFRNIGKPISALASVLSEDGGRVRFSGSDELNNQYFARGLRINGRTGRIEGRPFTSSVRKLARRASNSRANI